MISELLLPDINLEDVISDISNNQAIITEKKPYFLWRTKNSPDRGVILKTKNYTLQYSTKKHKDDVETEGLKIIPKSHSMIRSIMFLGYDDQKLTFVRLFRPLRMYASGYRNGGYYKEIPDKWLQNGRLLISVLRKKIG